MKEQPWHRRHAIQLGAQLPEGKEDALLVLEATKRLVTLPGFWDGQEQAKKPTATIVRIGGGEGAPDPALRTKARRFTLAGLSFAGFLSPTLCVLRIDWGE